MKSANETVTETLHQLICDINEALGSDRPDNWTRDGILNQIKELQEAKESVLQTNNNECMVQRINEQIQRISILADLHINKEPTRAKWLDTFHIIVKTNRNLYDIGFFKDNICKVIAETEEKKLVVKRMEDNIYAVVDKKDVSYPTWGGYPF